MEVLVKTQSGTLNGNSTTVDDYTKRAFGYYVNTVMATQYGQLAVERALASNKEYFSIQEHLLYSLDLGQKLDEGSQDEMITIDRIAVGQWIGYCKVICPKSKEPVFLTELHKKCGYCIVHSCNEAENKHSIPRF